MVFEFEIDIEVIVKLVKYILDKYKDLVILFREFVEFIV